MNCNMMRPGVRRALAAAAVGLSLAAATPAATAADYKILVPAAGPGGTIGLAQLINNSKGDGGALMASGKGMVSAVFINQSPVTLSNATPIARLTGEFEVLVVPASSLMTDDEFRHYVDAEQKAVFKLVNDLGLVKK